MNTKVFIEENGSYQIDFSETIRATNKLNDIYKDIGNFLSDVDFIAETKDEILLIEYKNTDLENANNQEAFYEKVSNGRLYNNILKKYYIKSLYESVEKKIKEKEPDFKNFFYQRIGLDILEYWHILWQEKVAYDILSAIVYNH